MRSASSAAVDEATVAVPAAVPTTATATVAITRHLEYEAMLVLALEPPLTEARVKARYKKLVKVHHPDINGGAKEAEERFKEIQRAYQTIMERLSS